MVGVDKHDKPMKIYVLEGWSLNGSRYKPTPPKTNECPLRKGPISKGKDRFLPLPLFFRVDILNVSFLGCTLPARVSFVLVWKTTESALDSRHFSVTGGLL